MNSVATNIVLYSLQIAFVVGIAAVAASTFHVQLARVRLAYWRLVGLTCLALPVLSRMAPQEASGLNPSIVSHVGLSIASSSGLPANTLTWLTPIVLIVGATARGAWLAFGMLRLRRLRGLGSLEALEPDVQAMVSAVAPHVEFRWDDAVTEPVTFGYWRPVVLLPRRLLQLPADIRRAVVLHETWHVARHDWLWLVFEQVVQTIFWFHPAMWWTVDQIQLAREQVVDALVVKDTGSRHAYLRAMISFADVFPAAVLAAPFLRRRHLVQRVKAIATIAQPPALHSIVAATVLIVVTGSSAFGAALWLPLQQSNPDAPAYEVGNGVTLPVVITEVHPDYTSAAQSARIQGVVLMTCVVATDGQATRVSITRSLDSAYGLDDAAVRALQQWRFKAGTKDGKAVPVRVQVEMTFKLK